MCRIWGNDPWGGSSTLFLKKAKPPIQSENGAKYSKTGDFFSIKASALHAADKSDQNGVKTLLCISA